MIFCGTANVRYRLNYNSDFDYVAVVHMTVVKSHHLWTSVSYFRTCGALI